MASEPKSADDALRDKWADQVAGIVLEAKLPFARELRGRGVDPVVEHRCCRGVRAATLRKRTTDWRPVRRILLAKYGVPFPTEIGHLLDYVETKYDEGVHRTWFSSFPAALRFFETAGEVPDHERMNNMPTLDNTLREAAASRARGVPAAERRGRQAPQFLLALVGALEKVVMDEATPLYTRAYAWFKLLRHWCALRWEDTRHLRPDSFQIRARGIYAQLEGRRLAVQTSPCRSCRSTSPRTPLSSRATGCLPAWPSGSQSLSRTSAIIFCLCRPLTYRVPCGEGRSIPTPPLSPSGFCASWHAQTAQRFFPLLQRPSGRSTPTEQE